MNALQKFLENYPGQTNISEIRKYVTLIKNDDDEIVEVILNQRSCVNLWHAALTDPNKKPLLFNAQGFAQIEPSLYLELEKHAIGEINQHFGDEVP